MSWTQKTLGEIVNLKRGFDLPSSSRVDGPYPVFSSSGQTGTHSEAAVKGPCVVTGRYGTIGQVFFSDVACWPLNTSLYSTDFKGNDPKFVYYLLKTLPWRDYLTASAVPGINRNHVHLCPVCVPDHETQTAISGVLGLLDNKIELNSKLNGYLAELMNVQYQHSFCCNKSAFGSIYDIANVVYGAAFKSALFNEEKVGYPLIRIRDLSTFSPQYWTNEAHPKRVFVHPGDVLAGMDAEFTPRFWQGEMAVLNQRVCLFEPAADSGVSRSYLLMALKPLLAFIQNYASGTTVAHMGKGDLEALSVPIPAKGDLERFNTIAEPLREQIVQNSMQNRKLAALRDALLPKLMSGEIDVSRVDITRLNSHLA